MSECRQNSPRSRGDRACPNESETSPGTSQERQRTLFVALARLNRKSVWRYAGNAHMFGDRDRCSKPAHTRNADAS